METITLEKKAVYNLISLVTMSTAEIYRGENPIDNVKSAMQNQMLYGIVPQELQEHVINVLYANLSTMGETVTIEKEVLMNLIDLVAYLSVMYDRGVAPAVRDDGFLICIEKELNRGPLFNKQIPADLHSHILEVVNSYRQGQ